MLDVARQDPRNKKYGGEGREDPRWQSTNKPRAVRVEEELWQAVKARADQDGYETLNEAIVDVLQWYVDRPKRQKRLGGK